MGTNGRDPHELYREVMDKLEAMSEEEINKEFFDALAAEREMHSMATGMWLANVRGEINRRRNQPLVVTEEVLRVAAILTWGEVIANEARRDAFMMHVKDIMAEPERTRFSPEGNYYVVNVPKEKPEFPVHFDTQGREHQEF